MVNPEHVSSLTSLQQRFALNVAEEEYYRTMATSLSRALSLEWASRRVTVNVAAPCITETESRKAILQRPGYKERATEEMLPAGRWNQPEDLVGAVFFPSHFSDMVVGHVLMVDGTGQFTDCAGRRKRSFHD